MAHGPQGTVFEPAHRADTAGKVVLVERYLLGRTETPGETAVSMQTQGPILGDREEPLAAVADLVEIQVAARHGGFQPQTLRVTAIREHTPVERGLRPADIGLDAEEVVAFGIEELTDLLHGVDPFLDLVFLQ